MRKRSGKLERATAVGGIEFKNTKVTWEGAGGRVGIKFRTGKETLQDGMAVLILVARWKRKFFTGAEFSAEVVMSVRRGYYQVKQSVFGK